jgi:hypothetical protein
MTVLPVYPDSSGQWVCPSLPVGEAVTCISIQKSTQHLIVEFRKPKLGDPDLMILLKEINEQQLKILLDLTLQ